MVESEEREGWISLSPRVVRVKELGEEKGISDGVVLLFIFILFLGLPNNKFHCSRA
jgi:hypothetical protein